jgi:hypothetical protein
MVACCEREVLLLRNPSARRAPRRKTEAGKRGRELLVRIRGGTRDLRRQRRLGVRVAVREEWGLAVRVGSRSEGGGWRRRRRSTAAQGEAGDGGVRCGVRV